MEYAALEHNSSVAGIDFRIPRERFGCPLTLSRLTTGSSLGTQNLAFRAEASDGNSVPIRLPVSMAGDAQCP